MVTEQRFASPQTNVTQKTKNVPYATIAYHCLPNRQLLPTLGPWQNNPESLYAEIRGQWLGRSVLDTPDTEYLGSETAQQTSCLTAAAYLKLRQRDNRLGAQAAATFISLAQRISAHPMATQHLLQAVPNITAANAAIRRLRAGSLPTQLSSLNRIAVDEAQDLSISELAVITELVKAVALNSGPLPTLLIAGDEAQTVQPSGFEWSTLRNHLETSLAEPQEYILDTDARAPAISADAIAKTNDLYSTLGPNTRPADRRAPPAGDANPGTVIIAVAPNTEAINLIIHQLASRTELVVISPTQLKPSWLHARVAASVLTPQQAKGTEHRTACVLLAGQAIANIRAASRQTRHQPVETIMTRASIDLLRVSMSRATENLIRLETSATLPDTVELFNEAPIYDARELPELVHQNEDNTITTDVLGTPRTAPGAAWPFYTARPARRPGLRPPSTALPYALPVPHVGFQPSRTPLQSQTPDGLVRSHTGEKEHENLLTRYERHLLHHDGRALAHARQATRPLLFHRWHTHLRRPTPPASIGTPHDHFTD